MDMVENNVYIAHRVIPFLKLMIKEIAVRLLVYHIARSNSDNFDHTPFCDPIDDSKPSKIGI